MFIPRFYPLTFIVPISLFLTASFFVFFALTKVTERWLKVFGYISAVTLLLSALVIFSGALAGFAAGPGGIKCPVSGKSPMGGGMTQMMRQRGDMQPPMPEK
jgi:hypothetical protein